MPTKRCTSLAEHTPFKARGSDNGWCCQVAQVALPVFLKRVRSILHLYRTSPKAERHLLQGCLCCLETLAAMTLAPAVTDVVLPPSSRLKVRLDHPVLTLCTWQYRSEAAPHPEDVCMQQTCTDVKSYRIVSFVLCEWSSHCICMPSL